MKTGRLVVGFTLFAFMIGGTPILTAMYAFADGLRVDKRMDSRQERRGDAVENTADGVKDRHEFREERRDCVGDGPDCRSDNRQDKRGDRQDRTTDRVQDKGDRLNKRF